MRGAPDAGFRGSTGESVGLFRPPRGDDRDGHDGISLPIEAESLAVPADDRLGFDYDQCGSSIPSSG